MAGDITPKKKEPTAQEAMFFFAIVKHTRNKADIDWNSVASEQGFKNADVAKVRFGQVKRKLGITTESPAIGTSPCATARTPTKKSGGSVGGTPTKVVKTPGRAGTKGKPRGKPAKKEESEDDDDDDQTVAVKDEDEDGEEYDQDAELHAECNAFLNEDNDDPF
ncbi:hypothetical protein QQS21_003678 [Conoideocrella luteorostrata]|uniref:Myb-like DNA-binding domain-containing protein n=1 Tax=Conoideocrella luteorostrata TaxID=1105319 RepID=A0AAJ0CX22_9HYPO|nr:hypothetical protein QQS21_003678 [Conoideocrella luteorostrata]